MCAKIIEIYGVKPPHETDASASSSGSVLLMCVKCTLKPLDSFVDCGSDSACPHSLMHLFYTLGVKRTFHEPRMHPSGAVRPPRPDSEQRYGMLARHPVCPCVPCSGAASSHSGFVKCSFQGLNKLRFLRLLCFWLRLGGRGSR